MGAASVGGDAALIAIDNLKPIDAVVVSHDLPWQTAAQHAIVSSQLPR